MKERFADKAIKMEFEENSMGLISADIYFADNIMKFENEFGAYMISFGYENPEMIVFPRTNYKTLSTASWTDDHTFLIKLNVIEEDFSPVYMEFGFGENNHVSVHFKNTSEPEFLRSFSGFAGGEWREKQKIWTNRRSMVR